MYKIQRIFYRSGCRRTIKTVATVEEAQAHCSDPETSSSTCKGRRNRERTYRCGPWFDCYTECRK
jgi:hypothetical protein